MVEGNNQHWTKIHKVFNPQIEHLIQMDEPFRCAGLARPRGVRTETVGFLWVATR
ncbi:MAG: hypothetical protein HC802_16735 [Caldilineaceae bacterium]|nr:hypothetical protein [Caldilineaceae bacterium]